MPHLTFHYIPQSKPRQAHFELVERLRPAVYGLSFTSYGADLAYSLMREMKQRFPWLTVVAGGAHVSAIPEEVLTEGGADICVLGEGEVTFAEILARHADLPAALPGIKGIAYRDATGCRRTGPRPLLDDLDAVPLPARDLIDPHDFVGLSHRFARPNTEMIITRGCPYRCVFCANPVFRVPGGALYRERSPACIAAEAELLYQMGYRELFLHSDELNVRHDWSVAVCQALAALGHKDLYFQANLRVQPMSEELAHWMRRAGFWLVRFGIESGSQRVLNGIKKKMALEKTEHACRLVSAEGIRVFGYFMMFQFWEEDGRLEWETPAEVEESLRLVERLWRAGVLHYSSWMFAIPVQGAEYYDIAVRHGMVKPPFQPSDTWDPTPFVPGVTAREFSRLFRRARWLQARMALKAGSFELRNWRALLSKGLTALRGHAGVPLRRPTREEQVVTGIAGGYRGLIGSAAAGGRAIGRLGD
ncbi:MAG: B12-binding domain-containing radical SAM protein [Gemmatimonadales bacterium]|nr:B12-binding domain-containing radical SAM protein [Gemmatimonadales bacterium]